MCTSRPSRKRGDTDEHKDDDRNSRYTGHKVNSLQVEQMVGRRPEPRYAVLCTVCGSRSTESQARIRSGVARCLNSGCGRDWVHKHVSDTPTKARKREEAAEEAKRRERETQEAAEIEATKQAFQENTRAVALAVREQVSKGKDDGFFVSPELAGASMSNDEASRFNREQAAKFARENPEYEAYRSSETVNAIGDYLARNGVRIADAVTVRAAFLRLKEYGLIRLTPLPEPEPAQRPTPRVNLTIAPKQPEQPTGPKAHIGRDWKTGQERTFTEREVNRMSSAEYKRAFPIAPTFSELFTAMEEQR